MLIAFPSAWLLDRDRSRDMARDLRELRMDFDEQSEEIAEFHRQPRFTLLDHQTLIGPIKDDLSDLEDEVQSLEARVDWCRESLHSIRENIAELPQILKFPFDERWQEMIIENQRAITACGCTPIGSYLPSQRKHRLLNQRERK